MSPFFYHLREYLAARFGTSRGNEKNVHHTKAGPGRMPPNRQVEGRKRLRRYERPDWLA